MVVKSALYYAFLGTFCPSYVKLCKKILFFFSKLASFILLLYTKKSYQNFHFIVAVIKFGPTVGELEAQGIPTKLVF